MKKTSSIQIRITEKDKALIDKLYALVDDFNVSSFVRQAIRNYAKEIDVELEGIGNLKIQ